MAIDYEKAQLIFYEALARAGDDERRAYLDQACAGDAELRAQIDRLLQSHRAAADSFLPLPKTAGPAEADIGAAAGTVVGRYKLLQQIGEGGFGVVFMAEQEYPVRRRVALKIIKLGMDTRQVIARFEAERQALAMMDHPGVAKVLDAGATESGRPYFVMELVIGRPITEYCDQNNLSIEQRLKLFIDVCQAVQHAHQKGLIHRDIKPSNVLVATVDDRPHAKIIDFGIAKATQSRLTEKTLFTEFAAMIGTPQYMSPEQAQSSLDIDTRSDVYSLGVLLYELLTGATPFDPRELRAKAFGEIQRIIREVDPPTPSSRLATLQTLPSVAASRATEPRKLNAAVRGEMDWIVMKCLEKNRAHRYDSAAALAADISHHLADEPVSAGKPSRGYRLAKFVRRNKGAVVATSAVAAALIIGLIGTTIGLISESRRRVIAERQVLENELNVADVLHATEDFPRAEAMYRRVIAYRPDSTDLVDRRRRAMAMMRLAALLGWEGRRLDEVDRLGRESVAAARAAYPPDDQNIAMALRMHGEQFLERDVKRAEQLMREAVEIRRKGDPMNYLALGKDLSFLGGTLRRQQRFAEAEPFYREALSCYRRHFPYGDPRASQVQSAFACVLIELNRFKDAEAELLDSIRRENNSWSHSYTEACLLVLYTLWNEREPGNGYDRKALEWANKVVARYVVQPLAAPIHPAATQPLAK